MQYFSEAHFPVTAIHGDLPQQERYEALRNARSGQARILITTDQLSRGIDIQTVNVIVNYDMPPSKNARIHRACRCARYGRDGVCATLAHKPLP